MQNSHVIYEFTKNTKEKVRAEFSQYLGKDLFSIRVYYQADEKANEWWPTRKGLTIRTSFIPELKEALDLAYQQCVYRDKTRNGE